ncbi:tetratricopeptide repeat protein [bacterium]|nr:tetratricopeptide repeat protein [bacterium]
MGVSNKKRKYIKKFAYTKSADQLSKDTGLSADTVLKVLKSFGIKPVKEKEPETEQYRSAPAEQSSDFWRRLYFVLLCTAIFFTPLFFISGLYDMYSLPKSALLCVLYPVGGIIFFLYSIYSKKIFIAKKSLKDSMFLILFVLLGSISLLWSVNKYEAILHLNNWGCTLLFLICSLCLLDGIKYIRWITAAITLSAFIVAVMGIFQFNGYNPSFLYQAAVPGSFFGNKNFAAQFIVGALPFSLYCAYLFREKFFGIFSSVTFFMLLFFLVITRTRGAWVASSVSLAAGLVLLVVYANFNPLIYKSAARKFFKKHLKFILPGTACFLILLAATFMPGEKKSSKTPGLDLGEEITSIAETNKGSAQWRLTAWRNTLQMIKSHWVKGVGLGNWQFYYPLFARKGKVDKDFNEERQAKRNHNDYLQIAAELGIPGFCLFLLFLAIILFSGLKLIFKNSELEWGLLGITGIVSVLSIMGNAMFSFPLQETLPLFFLGVVSSLIIYGKNRDKERYSFQPKKISFLFVLGLIIFSALFYFNLFWAIRLCRADYHFLKGKGYSKGKMYEQSLAPLRKSIKLNPYNFKGYSLLGRSLNELHYYHDSVVVNKLALKLHPYYINCMNNLGNALRGIYHVDDSIAVYKRALELFPDFAEAHNNLGIAYKEKKDIPAAEQEYKKAIEIDPSYEKAYNNLGNIYLNQGRIDDAVQCYLKAIKNNPELSDVYNNIGLAMLKKKNYKKAVEYFDDCIKRNSRLPDPHNNKGTALRKMGKYDDAIVQFKKAVMIDSEYLPAYNNIAETYLAQKKINDAVAQYEKMLKINPSLKSIYQRLSELYFELYTQEKVLEYLDKAIETIDRAIGMYPENVALRTVKGKYLMESGQKEKALELFKKIVELAPHRPESYYNLGIAYHQNTKLRAALKNYKKALELQPEYYFLYFEIGKIYEELKMYNESLSSYQKFKSLWKGDESYIKKADAKITRVRRRLLNK